MMQRPFTRNIPQSGLAKHSQTCLRQGQLTQLGLPDIPRLVSTGLNTDALEEATHHAHDISRLFLWQKLGACLYDLAVFVLGLTTRETSNGYTWRVSCDHLGSALSAHVKVETALNDAEQVLAVGVLVGLYAAVKPANRALHGLLHAGMVGRSGGNDIVELHDDVGADRVLQRDGVLRREQHGRAIVGAEEAHTFLCHLCELEQ